MTRSRDNLASALAGEQMVLEEREGGKNGDKQTIGLTPPLDKLYCTTQHVRQPVRSSSDGVSGQEAATGPGLFGQTDVT